MSTTRRYPLRPWLTLAVFAGALLAASGAPACTAEQTCHSGCCPDSGSTIPCCTGLSNVSTGQESGDQLGRHVSQASDCCAGCPDGSCVCLPQTSPAQDQKPSRRAEESRPDPGAGLRFEPSLGGDAAP